jgi:hypothetical protein
VRKSNDGVPTRGASDDSTIEEDQFLAQMQHHGPEDLRQLFLELHFVYGISSSVFTRVFFLG